MRIAYQGVPGSFSHRTVKRLFPEDTAVGFASFREAFEAVEQGEAKFALMPIENTLAGTIYETIDLLAEGSLSIVGMVDTPVVHCLGAIPGASKKTVQKVLSHPKALMQCGRFFQEHSWMEAMQHFDTAGAAKEVALEKDPSMGAIASREALEMYGLVVLEEAIQDSMENYTRFFLVSKSGVIGRRTSLCFTLEHLPGSLAEALGTLSSVNLTYLVSRPLRERPYEYLFYADVIGEIPVEELEKKTKFLKILGSYDDL